MLPLTTYAPRHCAATLGRLIGLATAFCCGPAIPHICSAAAQPEVDNTPLRAVDAAATPAAELVAHWPLVESSDPVQARITTSGRAVAFFRDDAAPGGAAARFDGRTSLLESADCPELNFGRGDFSIALWLRLDERGDDLPGDLIGKYDPTVERGWGLSLVTNNGAPSGTPNQRQLEFFVAGGESRPEWVDCGRPGRSVLPYALAAHDGRLYAGTCEPGPSELGRVYRYEGGTEWSDRGAPGNVNAVSSLCEYQGELYAGVSRYRLRGSALPESENQNPGGRVYRYQAPDSWIDCGQLPGVEAINGMTVFQGKLYASSTYSPGVFRYEGDRRWTDCGSPGGRRVEALAVYNGRLLGTGYDAGEVYAYDGRQWSTIGKLPETTQTYGFAVFRGELYVSSWPTATVFRYERDGEWIDCGRMDQELESMGLAVYQGQLYAGTLPLAEVFRYRGGRDWQLTGRLDFTPEVKYRRAWSLALYDGRLLAGTLPSGRVWAYESGRAAHWVTAFPAGWHHVAAIRRGQRLELLVDGGLVARSRARADGADETSSTAPLRIGLGPHDHLCGWLADVRLYRGALGEAQIAELAGQR